jgi:hypothetical protein
MDGTYATVREAVRQAMEDDRAEYRHQRSGDKWPVWFQLLLSVLIVVVTVVLAYAALDKRITLVELKIDQVLQAQKVGR